MSRDNALLSQLALAVGFLFVLCVASSLADPLPLPADTPSKVDVSSSVATPLGSAQLVASASDRDEGLRPVPPKEAEPSTTLESDDGKQSGVASAGGAVLPPPASEVGDMMKDPYHNVTISTSDRDEEALINNETDVVHDTHVNPINKTHEEEASDTSPVDGNTKQPSVQDGSPVAPLDSSTQQPSVQSSSSVAPLDSGTQQPSVQSSSSVAPLDSSTSKVEESEREEKIEDKEHPGKTSQERDVTEKEGDVSLAEVTSPPVLALVSQHDAHDHPAISRSSSLNHTTQAAAILAGVLVLVAVIGYLGLLMWRRLLEKRYGNREMLVNEDDDFKHFEL